MGGQSMTTQTQQSKTAPWQASQPLLQRILQESMPVDQPKYIDAPNSGIQTVK